MACKCFVDIPGKDLSLLEKITIGKCKCASRFQAEENKRVFVVKDAAIENLDKIKIDDYIIRDAVANRCDYLFIYDEKRYIFVELKGVDIKHGILQLKSSVELFYKEGILSGKQVRCYIVFSHFPKDNGTYRKEVKHFYDSWKKKIPDLKIDQQKCKIQYSVKEDTFV